MILVTSKKFDRQFKKLPKKIQFQFEKRAAIFLKDEFDPLLNNHKFSGQYNDYRSINITGDYRLVYFKMSLEIIQLVAIGTHSEIYS